MTAEATLPEANALEADYTQLVAQGFVSGHATQDKTRERVEQERDLAVQRAGLLETQAAVQESTQAKAALSAALMATQNPRPRG